MSNQLIVQQKVKSLQDLLIKNKDQIEKALPKHLNADRLLRIAMTEVRKNPALLECTQVSFFGAIIQTAQLGLEPNAALGHSYLVPFNNKKTGNKEVQFIIGYRGLLELAYRSPKVLKIVARSVYDADKFSYDFGLNETLVHVPSIDGSGDKLTHVYCIVELANGVKLFDVMTRGEIEAARTRAKATGEYTPWATDFEAMAKKTVIRRFFKFMPSSVEIQQAVGFDESGERGDQNNGAILEVAGIVQEKVNHTENFINNTEEVKEHEAVDITPQVVVPVKVTPVKAEKKIVAAPEVKSVPVDEQGAFSSFETNKQASVKDRSELILKIMDAADKIRVTKDQLNERCKRDYNGIMSEVSYESLQGLLKKLEDEYNSKVIK